MRRLALFWICTLPCLASEVRVLTLKETVALAYEQNPDVLLARLNEQKAQLAIRVARDPFIPKVTVGSGLAYSNGFPMSIEGSAPSIFQARATGSVYDPAQRYRILQAREEARAAGFGAHAGRDAAGLQAALMFLDVEKAGRSAEAAGRQVASLAKVAETVEARVREGRELPVESRRAALNLARAKQRLQGLEEDRDYLERSLAAALGFDADDRVRPAAGERALPELSLPEDGAVTAALRDSPELKRLEASLLARSMEARSFRAMRLPRVDLVGQYAMFARFNNYEDFFRRFQRHNGQIGVSFQLPLVTGVAQSAQASQAEAEAARLRVEVRRTRARLALETRRDYQELRKLETAREVARLDLDVARDSLGVLLARMEEGRAGLQQVEEARFLENEKWLALYDAHYALEKARYAALGRGGDLLAALR